MESHNYPLFKHMSETHNLTLLESEMDDIMRICKSLFNLEETEEKKELHCVKCGSKDHITWCCPDLNLNLGDIMPASAIASDPSCEHLESRILTIERALRTHGLL